MNLLEKYYNTTIKADLINKFNYKTSKDVPKLNSITLNFGSNLLKSKKTLASASLALEMITKVYEIGSKITKSSQHDLFLEIKKGQPVGCKVVLKHSKMYPFLFKLLTENFPKTKKLKKLRIHKNKNRFNSFSFSTTETEIFDEISNNFQLFSKLPSLDVTVTTTAKTKLELTFLLKSFKFPIN